MWAVRSSRGGKGHSAEKKRDPRGSFTDGHLRTQGKGGSVGGRSRNTVGEKTSLKGGAGLWKIRSMVLGRIGRASMPVTLNL